jgi:hypothetical protein
MPDLELSWHAATIIAGCLALAVPSLRRSPSRFLAGSVPYAQESAVILGLFALWQYAGSFGVMGPDGALGRAQWIWDAERVAHLPSETTVQAFFLPHPLIVQFFNYYYASLHFPVLVAILIIGAARTRWRWLWLLYPAATTLIVAVTANHFWADGIVAAAVLLAVLAVQHLVTKLRRDTPRYEAIAEKVDVASSR